MGLSEVGNIIIPFWMPQVKSTATCRSFVTFCLNPTAINTAAHLEFQLPQQTMVSALYTRSRHPFFRSGFTALLLLLIPSAFPLAAQTPGELDVSFETGSSVNGTINAWATADGDKIYIGGNFSTVRGAFRNNIARLNADGTVDLDFDPGSGAGIVGMTNQDVNALAVQSDGKVLIGGSFTSYNGTPRNRIARLNTDGSLDVNFDPGSGTDNFSVGTIVALPDGKILIGGNFRTYNGIPRSRIARLNADGSLDTSFDPGSGANTWIRTIMVQSDGRILIGGEFTSYNDIPRHRIARINANGSLDSSFDPGTGASSAVHVIALQTDGNILIGGDFTSYNDIPRNRIARLNANGSLDTSFDPGTGAGNVVYSIALQTDDRILIGGSFISYNGITRNRIARLNANGSLDTSFDPGTGANGGILFIEEQPDGTIFIGGGFFSYDGAERTRIARLNADGSLDTSFNPSTGAAGAIYCVALQPDGRILVGGSFLHYDGKARRGIVRLNSNGSFDSSFDPGTGPTGSVYSIAVQSDGKILIGGNFTNFNDTGHRRIVRLNADGSLDTSFDPGTGTSSDVHSIVVQVDGKVLIGGLFTTYNGITRNRIARLNTDGSLDTSFDPGNGASTRIRSISLQLDGKIVVGGEFTSYNGTARNRVARLNTDGSLDTSFDPGTGANGTIHSIALQADGKVVIGGDFTSYDGTSHSRIARLNTDGSLDTSFDPNGGANGTVHGITLQSDGQMIVVGAFNTFNNTAHSHIVRLNANGDVDISFDPGTGTSFSFYAFSVYTIAMQSNGKILIGGNFWSYDNILRRNLARIHNNPASQSLTATGPSRVEWQRGGSAPEVEQVTFDSSPDGVIWTPIGNGTRISGGWELSGLNLVGSGLIRARGRTSTGGTSIIQQVNSYEFLPAVPSVTTAAIDGITSNSANGGGEVTADGGAVVIERGVVFSTVANPTVSSGVKVVSGSGVGLFITNLTGLAAETTYYVRAFATNSAGTGYGSEVIFVTTSASSAQVYSEAMTAAGLTGNDALPDAMPFSDGVPNLLKYAFNMNLAGPDASTMSAGGTSGLPRAGLDTSGETTVWRVEFIRRKGSGLVYVPQKSTTLDSGDFQPMSGTTSVTTINDEWERVIVEEPCDPATTPRCFSRVRVDLP